MVSGGPGLVVAYGSYERKIWEEKRVVFILDIARGEEAKGEQWETGRRVMRRIAAANREWADEYHLVARAVTKHATKLYEKIGFKRDVLGGTEREYQPRPAEWLEEYWTVKATVLETELQGEVTEGGRWPRTYALEEGLKKGSGEWKGVKKIHERTHKSDRGGDGTLWTKHDKGTPHVVVYKETGNTMERDEVQGVDDPAFHEEEEDDPEEGRTVVAGNTLTEEQRERARKSREVAMRKRAEREAQRETEQEANDRAYEEAYEDEMGRTEGGDEQAAGEEEAGRAEPQGGEGTTEDTETEGEAVEIVEGGGKNMRLRAVLMNVNGRVQTVRRTDGGGGGRGKYLGEGGDLRTEAGLGANQVAGCMREREDTP